MRTNEFRNTAVMLTALIMAVALPSPAEAAESSSSIGWFRRVFCSLSYSEIEQVVKSPKEIARRVYTQVDYVEDLLDEMRSAEETWEGKQGDCEDFAACIVDLCHLKGFEAWIHVFYEQDNFTAHAVAMGRYNGKLWISSNGWYQSVESIKDAEREIAREMGWNRNLVASSNWDTIKDDGFNVASVIK